MDDQNFYEIVIFFKSFNGLKKTGSGRDFHLMVKYLMKLVGKLVSIDLRDQCDV